MRARSRIFAAVAIAALFALNAPQGVRAQQKNVQQPFASAARTATATSSTFDVGSANYFVGYLSVTASSGTSPTLDVKFQDSADGSTWFDLAGGAFSQVTGSTSSQAIVPTRVVSRNVRAVATIGGTSPSFTFAVQFMAVELKGATINSTNTDGSALTGLNASSLASGTVPDARFPATIPAASGANLTALNATNLGSGTVPDARFPATIPAASGVNLTNLNATNLASGTVPLARLTGIITNNEIAAAAAIDSSKLAQDVSRTAQVTVTSAQVLALNTTPIALVAAPGAGQIVLIDEITAKLVFNTIAYTGANNLEFRYTNGAGAKVSADVASTFINTASGTAYANVKGIEALLTPVANAAVVVTVPVANPAAGNSNITFTIHYRIVTP